MKEYIDFSKMITPFLITALWVVLSILFTLIAILQLFTFWPNQSPTEKTVTALIFGATVIVGLVGIRVAAEVVIVLFKINENLAKIAHGTPAAHGAPATPTPRLLAANQNITVTSFDEDGKPQEYKPKVFLSE